MASILSIGVLSLPGILFAQEKPPVAVPPAEASLQQLIIVLDSLGGVLNAIHDKATADAAAPKIVELAEKMEKIKKEAKAIPDPAPGEKDRLERVYGNKMSKVLNVFIKNTKRLQNEAFFGSEELRSAFLVLGNKD